MKHRIDYVVFEVTPSCNLDCRYCYNIWKRPGDSQPPPHSYRRALRTLKRLFSVAEVSHITFTGGEPFLADRLAELVLFCRMQKKDVTVITNGNAGSEKRYRELLSLGVSLFELPLHSPDPRAHDAMTGVAGSWQKSLDSIRLLHSLNAAVVPVIVITKENCRQVGGTVRFLYENGCYRIMLNRFNVGGSGIARQASMQPSLGELRQAFTDAHRAGAELKVSLSSNVCTPACVLDPAEYPSIAFSVCHPENISRRPLTLTLEGDMRFCNHSPVVMGNIFDQPLDEIVNSAYVKEWRETVPRHCAECKRYRRCFGGCRAASEQVGLTLGDVDPIVKEFGVPVPS
jgi:radical SAM protein with 4Fe4S-binding SPASM domain